MLDDGTESSAQGRPEANENRWGFERRGNRSASLDENGFKRKSEQSFPKDAKRSRPNVGVRLKEHELGILEYIGGHDGFSAIIKQRFNDFHVNEIAVGGQMAKLNHQDIPIVPDDDEHVADLEALIPTRIWVQLQDLKVGVTCMDIDVTSLDKNERRAVHIVAKSLANVTSETVNEGDKKMIKITSSIEVAQKMGRTMRKDNREDWTKRGGDYCHFVLHKVNNDTGQAVNLLASRLRIKPDHFGYAGMKDRRAWTSQWISLKKVDPCKVLMASRHLRGVFIGNFKYAKTKLRLGTLHGNRFRIALRNVSGTDEEVERAMTSLRDHGFINYYGLQRFGTVAATPTHEIGKCLLRGKWNEAIELILKPRPNEHDRNLAEARQIYADTKNPQAAHARIRRLNTIESRLLKGLQTSGSNNPQGAFDFIPRNIRLMYVHAYQSLVWNYIVSRRIKEYGTKVVVGDLVYAQDRKEDAPDEITDDFSLQDNDKDNAQDKIDATCTLERNDGLAAVARVNEDNSKQQETIDLPKVKILTEEDLPNYTLTDVVMPQPGWRVTYPRYAKAWYDEFLAKDGLTVGLSQKNKKFSLSGTYRRILEIPTDLSWRTMHYNNEYDDFILSDIDEMKKCKPPQDNPDGKFKALIIEMCLKSSSYATMALREISKTDTSVETQAALSASHAENASNINTTEESSNSGSGDANTENVNVEQSAVQTPCEKPADTEKDDATSL